MTFTPATKEEAIAAATAAAFTDEDGRTTIHSVMIGGNLMLGADWDLDAMPEPPVSSVLRFVTVDRPEECVRCADRTSVEYAGSICKACAA